MKRAVLLALALAAAAVPLTAPEAGAANGRPDRDRDELIEFVQEHGHPVALPTADLGAGLTQDGLFEACQHQTYTDPHDGLNVDVLGFDLAHDCGTRTWAFGLSASAAFGADIFDHAFVAIDTDMNLSTGDLDGTDYLVLAAYDDDLNGLVTGILRTPSANSSSWLVVGQPRFGQAGNLLALQWAHAAIGSPSQFRWYGELSTLADAGLDSFPNNAYVSTGTPAPLPVPPLGQPARFVPVNPTRIMDTRSGIGVPAQKPYQFSTLRRTVAGTGLVPADAVAVALNVTATEAEDSGYVTVYPTGHARPLASNLNYVAGQTVAGMVVAPVGAEGKVSFYAHQPVHLVADVSGYWVPASSSTDGRYQSLNPARILDTRAGIGAPAAKLPARQPLNFAVRGRGGVPASGVSAVVLNVTMTEATAQGWVAAYPGGTAWPGSSNLNVERAGQTIPNLVVVPVGADGSVNLLTLSGGHLIADVAGYFTDASAPVSATGLFVSMQPIRIVDTRASAKLAPASSVQVSATGVGIPPSASAALLNVTNVENNGPGFLTVYPSEPRPFASNLNMDRANQVIPNSVVATLSNGTFRVYSQPGSHLVVDTSGYFTA